MTLRVMLRCTTLLVLLSALVLTSALAPNKTLTPRQMRERGQNPSLKGYSRHQNKKYVPELPRAFESQAVEDYLLPTSTVPISMDIRLIPYLVNPIERNFTFDGQVIIKIFAAEATSSIVMHASEGDIMINSITVIKESDLKTVAVESYDILSDDRQFLTINLVLPLEFSENYDVTIIYTGILNDQVNGFFRSGYIDENGNQDWLAITDLEPTGARRFLPCYDQPDLKTRVTLHLAKEPGHEVTANMPIAVDNEGPVEGLDGWEWVQFQETPLISTYLICFATHKFASITSLEDIRYKVYARPAVVQYGEYTTEITPGIIRYMEQFTNVPFHLPKYDQIALVEFFSGAMENWGLVTYLEPYVLYNPATDDTWSKIQMAQIVSHETAHQWFGDLVSPKWWSNLWLNEGFATYFEYWGTTLIGPDWQMDQQFVVDMMHSAFRVDAGPSHPIYADYVDDPSSLTSIFDSISYNKGGCLVRFMINFLGEENFMIGINNYLTFMGYSAAHQDDLFFHLSPEAPPMPDGLTFKDLMDTWTLQAGYPLITVTRNYNDQSVTFTQTRYGTTGSESWIIPLTFTSADSPDFNDQSARAWLTQPELTMSIEAGSGDWFLLNIKQTGYYRVNYDATNWALLTSYMSMPGNAITIDPVNRAQILDDAWTFAEAGILDYVTALTTTLYLDQETLLVPWEAALDHLDVIRDRIYSTQEGVDLYQDYARRKLNLAYNTVNGFSMTEYDEHGVILARWVVTRAACNMEHVVCNNQGSDVFQQWVVQSDPDNNNPIHLDLRGPAYCAGQRYGGQAEYDFLLSRYVNSEDRNERDIILMALGCASDVNLLQDFLDESLSTSVIRDGDALDVLEAVFSHPRGVDMALDFLILHWQQLEVVYGGVGNGFISIAEKLNTQEQYDKIFQFRDEHAADLNGQDLILIATSLSITERHIMWNNDYLEPIMEFFRQN